MKGVQYRNYVDLCYEQFPIFYILSVSISLSSELIKKRLVFKDADALRLIFHTVQKSEE